jgi:hypothetical protein
VVLALAPDPPRPSVVLPGAGNKAEKARKTKSKRAKKAEEGYVICEAQIFERDLHAATVCRHNDSHSAVIPTVEQAQCVLPCPQALPADVPASLAANVKHVASGFGRNLAATRQSRLPGPSSWCRLAPQGHQPAGVPLCTDMLSRRVQVRRDPRWVRLWCNEIEVEDRECDGRIPRSRRLARGCPIGCNELWVADGRCATESAVVRAAERWAVAWCNDSGAKGLPDRSSRRGDPETLHRVGTSLVGRAEPSWGGRPAGAGGPPGATKLGSARPEMTDGTARLLRVAPDKRLEAEAKRDGTSDLSGWRTWQPNPKRLRQADMSTAQAPR